MVLSGKEIVGVGGGGGGGGGGEGGQKVPFPLPIPSNEAKIILLQIRQYGSYGQADS